MSRYLLDANVLIALTVAEHEHHRRATAWLATVDGFAVCPVVEGALVRFLARLGERPAVAVEILRAVGTHPRGQFWPDSLSYADVELAHVRGHRKVTDAYLAGLAVANGGRLATLDAALAQTLPDAVVLIDD